MGKAQQEDPWCQKMKAYLSNPLSAGSNPEIEHEAPQFIVQGDEYSKLVDSNLNFMCPYP
jgi:hypothetical protein